MSTTPNLFDKDAFKAGYLIAVANIIHLHGEEVIARDVLEELQIDHDALNQLRMNEYDYGVLKPLFGRPEPIA